MTPEIKRQLEAKLAAQGGAVKRKNKYGAKPVVIDGIRFDSKAEGRYYLQLKHRWTVIKDVRYFLRQVPIHLPGGVTMRIDFQVHYADGTITYEDVKGHATRDWLNKKKIAEALYPFEIKLITGV